MRYGLISLGLFAFILVSTPSLSAVADSGFGLTDKTYPVNLQPEPGVCEKLPEWRAAPDIDLQANLDAGAALEFGYCGPADPAAAIPYYEAAARVHSWHAMVRLGSIFFHRRGGTDDPQRAEREFRSAMVLEYREGGDQTPDLLPPWTEAFIREFGFDGSDIPDRERFIRSLLYVERGDWQVAQALYGAHEWRDAVAKGPAALKHLWGLRLRSGVGIRKFPIRGVTLLYQAMEQDPTDLRIQYDFAHGEINGLHAFTPLIREQMRRPEMKPTREERYDDLWLGVRTLEKIARQGFAPAQLDLGLWMADGLNGLNEDLSGGYQWLYLARESGLAIDGLVERVGARLNPAARAVAEMRAKRGKASEPELADAQGQ